jgi:hypothetical protein
MAVVRKSTLIVLYDPVFELFTVYSTPQVVDG